MESMPDDKFYKLMTKYKPFKCNQSISLSQVFSRFSMYFMYQGAEVMLESDPNIINSFIGL